MKSENKQSYRMPAEWEPHSAIWLAWPYDEITFPGRVEKAEAAFVKMLNAIHMSERAELLVLDEDMKERACEMLTAPTCGSGTQGRYSLKTARERR